MTDRDVMLEFLEAYRTNRNLWDRNDPFYFNKSERNRSYNELLQILLKVEPKATQKTIVSKIDNIQSVHRRERKKVLESLSSDKTYVPTLWYYKILDFLNDESITKQECQDSYMDIVIKEEWNVDRSDETSNDLPGVTDSCNVDVDREWVMHHVQRQDSPMSTLSGKKRKLQHTTSSQQHPENRDQYQFGTYVASELKYMSEDMLPYVKKLINEAIFEGHMGSLNRFSRVNVGESA